MFINSLQIGFGNEIPDLISLNIYLSGCLNNKKCNREACSNKQLHPFNNGRYYTKWFAKIEKMLQVDIIDCICLLGGEPYDQPLFKMKDLMKFIRKIRPDIKIYAYSGYDDIKIIEDMVNELKLENIYFGPFISVEKIPETQQWYSDYKSKFNEELYIAKR